MKFTYRRPQPLVPDVETIRALAGLLSETGLTEIEYAIGEHRIRVSRAPVGNAVLVNGGSAGAGADLQVGGDCHLPRLSAADSNALVEPPPILGPDHPSVLTSPIVGVAYIAREPSAAPFVQVGDSVNKGQTVLIIEAMKVMNEIGAPYAGRVTRIFVEDAGFVEYGAPLMLIE